MFTVACYKSTLTGKEIANLDLQIMYYLVMVQEAQSWLYLRMTNVIMNLHLNLIYPINEVIAGGIFKRKHTAQVLVNILNSGELNEADNETAISKAIELWLLLSAGERSKLQTKRLVIQQTTLLGEPIPVIHWEDGTMTTVPEEELPLYYQKLMKLNLQVQVESPLANIDEFVNVIDRKDWNERSS